MINTERWQKRKKELGWTLDDIAEKSGISRRTVARIFSGNPKHPDPSYNTIQAIEKALGVPPSLEWTEEEKAEGVGRHPTYLSEDEVEWLELRQHKNFFKNQALYFCPNCLRLYPRTTYGSSKVHLYG